MDLFSFRDTFPNAPGYQRTDTSYAAAKAIESDASRLQRKVLAAIKDAGDSGLTIDELAAATGEGRHSTQPRTSELKLKGLIKDGGLRRELLSGRKGICWVAISRLAT